jgi:hypothetical protein
MGDEYHARIYKVTKNNSLELDSLVLTKDGKNFAPNIYLLPYYEAYMHGTDIMELADKICSIYHQCSPSVVEDEFSYSYEDVKPNIIYRLVNFEKNRRLLEKVPHIRFLDLAITFHCLARNDEDGIGTIRITNEHMTQWKATLKELDTLSINNTRGLFPAAIRSMEEVIRGMLGEECSMEEDPLSGEMLDLFLCDDPAKEKHKMYILSNQKGINGATCLLYENVLRDFSDKIHSDFYILPSSIHEVILVPFEKEMNSEALSEMVRDVNRTQVACDEVLSDRVYLYSRKNNVITM